MDITSRDNRIIREFRHLLTDGKYRRQTGLFVVEGARLCEDAARSEIPIETVLYTAKAREQYPTQTAALCAVAPSYEIAESLASHISDTMMPQGLFCICRMMKRTDFADALSLQHNYAALEMVQDPGNLGTVIRTAEALGLNGIFLSDGCCDPYNPKVLRASMGGVFRLPLYTVDNLPALLTALNAQGYTSLACVVDETAAAIQSLTLGNGVIAVIGNEGNGLTTQTIAACSQKTTIPMLGRAESLNASLAAGIVFWEMMRKESRCGE